MNENKNEIQNTRQFQLLDDNKTEKRDYKKLMVSLFIVGGLFIVSVLLAYGIYIIKSGDLSVA